MKQNISILSVALLCLGITVPSGATKAQQMSTGASSILIDTNASIIIVPCDCPNLNGFTIDTGGSVENRGVIQNGGDWENNSSITSATIAGDVEFNGTRQQNIFGLNGTSFETLTVNNPTGLRVAQPTQVHEGLTFEQGKIYLDGNDLTIANSAVRIEGADSDRYVVANSQNGVDRLFTGLETDIAEVVTPVGTTGFHPITIKLANIPTETHSLRFAPSGDTIVPTGIDRVRWAGPFYVVHTRPDDSWKPEFDASFDLSHATVRGDISKYIARIGDRDGKWSTQPGTVSNNTIAMRGVSTLGTFVFGEPTGSGVNWLDESAQRHVRVFPNPATDRTAMIEVSLPTRSRSASLSISDITGKELQSVFLGATLEAGSHQYTLDVSTLPAGSYLISLQTEDMTYATSMKVVH